MTYLQNQATVFRQNANQGPPRWRWRNHFALTGVTQLFTVFVLSLFTYVANADGLPAPTAVSPCGNKIVNNTPTFQLRDNTGGEANTWRIRVSKFWTFPYFVETDPHDGSKAVCLDEYEGIDCWTKKISDTSFKGITFQPGTYYWQSRAGALNKGSLWSNRCKFTVEAVKPAKMVISPKEHDFGTRKIGDSTRKTFTLENTGGSDLKVEKIQDGGYFDLQDDDCSGETLASDETCTFDIVFTPPVEEKFSARISVYSNANDLDFNVVGNGIDNSSGSNGFCRSKQHCNLNLEIYGHGEMTSSDDSVQYDCEKNHCTTEAGSYPIDHHPVTVYANAFSGYTFKEWHGGGCDGRTSSSCDLVLGSPDEKYSDDVLTAIFESSGGSSDECPDDRKNCGEEPKDPQPEKVSLTIIAPNNGKVAGSGFDCGNGSTACKKEYDKGNVPSITLTATPNSGYNFSGWGNACTNSTGSCSPTVNGDVYVTANFTKIEYPELRINPSVGGNVTISPKGKSCGNDCYAYDKGDSVTLIANPTSGYKFHSWSGCTNSNGTQCTLSMTGDQFVTANFAQIPKYQLNVSLSNSSGKGTIDFSPVGTACGDNCYIYEEGTTVKLTATPSTGSTFRGWSACSSETTRICSISMTAPQTVTAIFNNHPPTVERLSPPENEPQELDIALTFKATDKEDGVITTTEKVLFKKKTDNKSLDMTCTVTAGGGKSGAETIFTCEPPEALEYGTEYVWKVIVTDKGGLSNQAEKWYFETRANQPPTVPEISSPASGATDIDPTQDLTLSCEESSDLEDEALTYDFFYFDAGERKPLDGCLNMDSPGPCTIPAAQLATGQTYFWQCAVKDGYNNPINGGPWSFVTQENQPPSQPTNIVIKNGGNEVDPASTEIDREQSVEFSWTASEDPEGDAITYQVCYKKATETTTQCYPKTSATSEISDQLDNGTDYEVFVVAEDSQGNKANSETVMFKTKAAPVKFTLEAKSGYANTLLEWGFAGTVDPNIVKYRSLRTKGADFSAATTVAEVDAPMLSDYDEEALEKEKNYCYLIEALDNNGDTLYQSNQDCVIFGETILALGPNGGLKGEIVDIPIPILNAGKLTIGSGEIWLRYDGSVIAVNDVRNTPITEGYTVSHSIQNEADNIKTVIISFDSMDPPEMMGEGSLVDVSFEVIGEFGQSSPLELVPFVDGQGGTKLQDNNWTDIDIKLTDSQFGVKKATRRLVRDGNAGVEPLFYVGEAYVRGDVRGDGTIETVDARMARFIGVGRYNAKPEQLMAGDVNLDNRVDSADATMIIHRILYRDWPGAPAHEIIKTRRLRRGTPIILSLEDVSGVSGSELTAMLRISNLVKLSALNLSIAFDTNVVEIVKVEKTGLAEDTQFLANPDNEAGMIHIGMDSQTPLNGDGDLAKITLRLVSGGSVRSTPLTIAQANLYDLFGRDFVISALQRTIQAQHGEAIITDIPEPPVIEDRAVETPIEDVLPNPSTTTTGLHSATCQLNDHSGNPIAGATVTMGDKTVITDEYGYCAVVGLTEGDYSVTASQDGYIFLAMPCKVGDENNCSLNFVNLNVGMAAPASCQIYAVNDKGVKDSQIFTVSLDDFSITVLGEYPKHDLEALDIDPRTDIIYLASGDNAGQGKKGHLYVLDGETGELFPVGSTGFAEIEDLAFCSNGILWAWAKGDGLITIDLLTGKGTLVYESEWDVEGLTIQENEDGSLTFFAAIDTELWFYDTTTETLDIACTGLPGETEALEMLPDGLILIGIHNDKALKLHALEPNICKVIADKDIPTRQFDDVEGMALPTKACME